jgi:RNA polymerase sigma-70 factor (ECF subfamily)
VIPAPADDLHALLAAVALRDGAAFRRLYDATSAKLFGFALRILKKEELAQEALQDGFVAIWHAASLYQPHLAAPLTWMATIVRNKALDLYRRRPHEIELDAAQLDQDIVQAVPDPRAGPQDAAELSSDAVALARCMAALEGLHRQAIGLAYYHDLSHSEIAGQLQLPIGTVKTWIRRGLEKLRHCLAKRELT